MRTENDINSEYQRELREVRRMKKEIRANENGEFGNEAQKNDILRDLERKWASRVDDYRREAYDSRQEAVKDAKRKVFNLGDTNGRNAVQHANSFDKSELEKQYRKADERNDHKLKHAIAYRGYNEGKGDLLEKWASENPTNRQEVDQLREATQSASDTMSLQNEYTSFGPMPTQSEE